MRTFGLLWVFLIPAFLVAACEGPFPPDQAGPSASTPISGEQPAESPVNPMSVVIGPNGLHSR
jgi:hypothetical protein